MSDSLENISPALISIQSQQKPSSVNESKETFPSEVSEVNMWLNMCTNNHTAARIHFFKLVCLYILETKKALFKKKKQPFKCNLLPLAPTCAEFLLLCDASHGVVNRICFHLMLDTCSFNAKCVPF